MNVRRLAKGIVLCCALGGCARAAPPSIVSPPAASAITDGRVPASDNAVAAPSRPRLRVEKAIGITVMRVVKDDNSEGSVSTAKCVVQILSENHTGKTRQVAMLNVDGAPAQHENILSLLKRKACEAGANAMVIETIGKTRVEGLNMDHLDAVALVVGTPDPPVDPSPVPKHITVTPEGPAVPKSVEVDPGASP